MSDGTRQFTVSFQGPNPRKGVRSNDQDLAGGGIVEVLQDRVRFRECRDDVPDKVREFMLADVANVESFPAEKAAIIRCRDGQRFVIVWLESAEDTTELASLLPTETTPGFKEERERARRFDEESKALSPRQWVTPAIVGLNVVVFVIMAMAGAGALEPNPEVHIRFGSNFGYYTWGGEPWRLLTSAFIHFGIIHLAFNMYALWNGGVFTERLFGSGRFLAIYLLSALAGSVVSSLWEVGRNSAGASGAVFGVYGALLAFITVRRRDIPLALLKSASHGALALIGYSLFIGAAKAGIDNAAHVGGLIGGALTGLLLARPFTREARAQPQPKRVAAVAVGMCAALAAASFPLWNPYGERSAEIRFVQLTQDLNAEEQRIIDEVIAIAKEVDAGRLLHVTAGERIEREIIPAWSTLTQRFQQIAPSGSSDSPLARRIALYQDYLEARDKAMRMTARSWRGLGVDSDAELSKQWMEVERLISALQADD